MQAISSEKVHFIIVKSREFDAKNTLVFQDLSGAPTDDDGLQDHATAPDDSTYDELMDLLGSFSDDELIELHAMVMLGRGDVDMDGWDEAIQTATDDLDENLPHLLLQIPQLSDYLADALIQFGHTVAQ
jgi:hypothetical protein